ncbi:MAG TPA: DUF5060 domain-containing protein [Planctomycetota bacterium]|nr:DUF5060 domain-containing protein [Planctomycetota bacterium]
MPWSLVSCTAVVCGLLAGGAGAGPATVFRVHEVALEAERPSAAPYVHGPEVAATFTGTSGAAAGRSYRVQGFWDGGRTWRIRFAPTTPGAWSYVTASEDLGLNEKRGTFHAVAATPDELQANPLLRGFLERRGHAWALSDGKPFVPVGDTQWSFAEEFSLDEFRQWMDALAQRGLNTMHGCIWLAIYTRNGQAPFRNRDPRTDELQVEYFRQLDAMVQYANDKGIMMGLCIGGFPDNSQWWRKLDTRERDDRWFRYCVARYSAHSVRWVLYGEVDEANPPWGKWADEVRRKAALVKSVDPYRHPIGSHHRSVDTSSADDPNMDYIEVQAQSGSLWQQALKLRAHGKPIWEEEYWYECKHDMTEGIRDTYRTFVAALGHPTFGSAMRAHEAMKGFAPAAAQQRGLSLKDYLLQHDDGLRWMGHFAAFVKDLDTLRFEPATSLVSAGQCGRFGADYLLFREGGGDVTIDLSHVRGSFDVTAMTVRDGQVRRLGAVTGGAPRALATGTAEDVALRLTRRGD